MRNFFSIHIHHGKMAKHETIQAEKREATGTAAVKRLRHQGIVPGVIYGAKQRVYAIQLNAKNFSDVARRHNSPNFIVNLEIEGAAEKTKMAVVQDVQRNPLNGSLVHVDFRAVKEDELISAVVPVELSGDPIGVKSGGLLEQLVHEIEVQCRPDDLPESISNNVEGLDVGQGLKVSELNLPKGVTVRMDGDVLIAIVNQTRAAVSEDAASA